MKSGLAGSGRRARAVVVTRKSLYTLLLERHGTAGQAEFYLRSRGEEIGPYIEGHERVERALSAVDAALPPDQRRTRVDREDLERFLFAPEDVVVIVGQDGLVPNVAKYLRGQRVIGVNPDPERYDGVLCTHAPAGIGRVMGWVEAGVGGEFRLQRRAMAEAVREDGQRLLALNEVFLGHRTHQSARYRLEWEGKTERHSSSGVICSTGTGATGWGRSIAEQRGIAEPLPGPEEASLAWFVREPFPSVATGTSLDFGRVGRGGALRLVSEMSDGGVVFADGIETDRVEFLGGQSVEVRVAEETLNLVIGVVSKAGHGDVRRADRAGAPRPRPEAVRGHRPPVRGASSG